MSSGRELGLSSSSEDDSGSECDDNVGLKDVFKLLKSNTKQLTKLNKKFGSHKSVIKEHEERLTNVEEYSSREIEIMKQKQLKKSIDIAGVPLGKDENIENIVIQIGSALGFDIVPQDISSCFRMGKVIKHNAKGEALYPIIVVDFVRESSKDSILRAAKNMKRTITTTDIKWTTQPISKIYLNERLTPHFKKVFLEARDCRLKNQFKYAWHNNGLVHARVEEMSPLLTFYSIEDIYEALGRKENSIAPDLQTPKTNTKSTTNSNPKPTSVSLNAAAHQIRKSTRVNKRKTREESEKSNDSAKRGRQLKPPDTMDTKDSTEA